MITIDYSDITRNLGVELQHDLDAASEEVRKVAFALEGRLKQVTPRDTGFAANSWQTVLSPLQAVVQSNCVYMEVLDHGHSKQAPSGFIEAATDSIVRSV